MDLWEWSDLETGNQRDINELTPDLDLNVSENCSLKSRMWENWGCGAGTQRRCWLLDELREDGDQGMLHKQQWRRITDVYEFAWTAEHFKLTEHGRQRKNGTNCRNLDGWSGLLWLYQGSRLNKWNLRIRTTFQGWRKTGTDEWNNRNIGAKFWT